MSELPKTFEGLHNSLKYWYEATKLVNLNDDEKAITRELMLELSDNLHEWVLNYFIDHL